MNHKPFLITYHAMEQYCARVDPGLPPHKIENLASAINDAKIAIETGYPRSDLLEAKTNDGQDQRRIDRPYPCVLVCKEEDGADVVVTVLGPNETVYAADEEIFAHYTRRIREGVVRDTLNTVANKKIKEPETIEDFVRRIVATQIQKTLDDRLARAAKDGLGAAMIAMSALARAASVSSAAAFELETIRRKHPVVYDLVQKARGAA